MSFVPTLPSYISPRISSELPDCSSPLTFDVYSRCSMSCTYCVPEDSGITMADGTIKKVQDVQVGEVLLGYNENTKKPEATTVLQCMKHVEQCYATFVFEDKVSFSTTLNHPIFTKEKGWIDARYVENGMHVLRHNAFAKNEISSKEIELIFKREKHVVGAHLHRLYGVWNVMVQRCHYPTSPRFTHYGLRGIQVCKEWRYNPTTFFEWAEQNGYDEGLEIDREDNDGDYTPENCRWVTHAVNSANRRSSGVRSSSGYTGVYSHEIADGLRFYIRGGFNESYKTAEQAAIIRDRVHGPVNFKRIPEAQFHWEQIVYKRTHLKKVVVYNFECWPNNDYCTQTKRPTNAYRLDGGTVVSNCFSHAQKDINPGTKEAPLQAVKPDNFLRALDGEGRSLEDKLLYKHFYSKKFLLHLGGLADSFCHYEKKYGVAYPIIEGILERNYPLMFSSKGPMIADPKYMALFEKHKDKNSVAFQFSIVTADDALAKKVEPGVPSPSQRFSYMKYLSDLGYWCILRLRPFIIGVTDQTLPQILEKAYQNGARAVSTEFYAMDHRCVGKMRKATDDLGKLMGIKDVGAYFNALSPKERGGYCRLNRLVKEQYVKYIYKFCLEHNMVFTCSDPDFKELCQSGNCCGLPPSGEHKTKDMNNWSSHQLTAKIMAARIHYHKTGECTDFDFNEVYKPTDWIFDEQALSHQDIGCTKYVYAIRKQLTLRHMLQEKWNNLNSYANPQSYFHGKITPIGLDSSRENLLYRYNPMEYEQRWKDEGIRLDMEWKDGKYE